MTAWEETGVPVEKHRITQSHCHTRHTASLPSCGIGHLTAVMITLRIKNWCELLCFVHDCHARFAYFRISAYLLPYAICLSETSMI